MKKVLATLMAMGLAVSALAGCGSSEKPAATDAATEAASGAETSAGETSADNAGDGESYNVGI